MNFVSKNKKKKISRVLERLEERNLEKFYFEFQKESGIRSNIVTSYHMWLGFSNEEKLCRIAFLPHLGRGIHIGFEESNFENCLEANCFP